MTISPECGQDRVVVVRPAEVVLVVGRWRHLHAAPIFIHWLQGPDPPHLFFYPPTLRPASEWTGGNYFCQKVMARGIAELTLCTAAAAATRAQPNFGVQN